MQYRKLGKLDVEVSALGFGAMRLPLVEEGDPGSVDETQAIEMMSYAFDHGVNYVDTAYGYHDGQSELIVGRVLKNGYRDSVYLATKMPIWEVKVAEDFDRLLDEQREKLQVEHIDFYLLHCLQAANWPKMRDLGVLEWGERAKADGRIGHLGFSFHDPYDAFVEIIDAYDWPVCQIQYNYVCEDVQAGTRGLAYAAGKGLAVIIMEPLFGGSLANPPEAVQAIWDDARRDPVDMALRWLWNKPEVSLVLSGMSALEQVELNVASASVSGIDTLTQEELDLIAQVQGRYEAFNPIPCTKCGYCMPCPNGVNIPRNFELYNEGVVYAGNSLELNKNLYGLLPEEKRASGCVTCRECEEKCPQQIEISAWMPRVHETLRRE